MGAKIKLKKRTKKAAPGSPRVLFIDKPGAGHRANETPEDPWSRARKLWEGQDEQSKVARAKAAEDPKAKKPKGKGTSVQSHAAEVEDDLGLFGSLSDGTGIINPPITPTDLEIIVSKNNILPSLIDAMETNIDGTGWELTPIEPEEMEDQEEPEEEEQDPEGDELGVKVIGRLQPKTKPKPEEMEAKDKEGKAQFDREGNSLREDGQINFNAKATAEAERQKEVDRAKVPLENFFNECWPGMSFLTVRRRLRRDQEKVGYSFMEVLRNDPGEVMFCRRLDPKKLRLVRLDEPHQVKRTVMRNGSEIEVEIELRARRFVQIIRRKIVYFKEFGEQRDLDRETGDFAKDGETFAAEKRGTEILFFRNKEDIGTPYGIPRWLSNVPSVVGSRKAEEFNLELFDSGGIPPLMILVQGGALATDVEQQLRDAFMASGSTKHQACIIEAYAVGDMDSAKNVKVTVEKFGAEQQNDSMFEIYITNCDKRVQRSFRLPSIFMGMSEDFSFATAFASYTVAEAQVFEPERKEFDEVINLMLMPELLNGKDFEFHSLPLAVRDTAQQLEAAVQVKEMIEPGDFVEAINTITNTNFIAKSEEKMQQEADVEVANMEAEAEMKGREMEMRFGGEGGIPKAAPGKAPTPGGPKALNKLELLMGIEELEELASRGSELMKKGFSDAGTAKAWLGHRERVAALADGDRGTYEALLAAKTFDVVQHDPRGMAEIAGCAAEVLAANQ